MLIVTSSNATVHLCVWEFVARTSCFRGKKTHTPTKWGEFSMEDQRSVNTVPGLIGCACSKWKKKPILYLFNYNRLLKVHIKLKALFKGESLFVSEHHNSSVNLLIWRLTRFWFFLLLFIVVFFLPAVNERCAIYFVQTINLLLSLSHVANWPKLTGLMNKQCLSPDNVK